MSALQERLSAAKAWAAPRGAVVVTLGIALVLLLVFTVASVLGDVEPNSALGITFGVLAAITLLLAMLYSIRRAMPARRALGPAHGYMQLHQLGGTLFLVLFLLHTDFNLPSGVLAFLLWSVSLWVSVTGFIGVFLQRAVPRILEPASSFEINLQRIPELVGELRTQAETAALRAGPRVQSYYEQQFAADMAAPRMVTTLRNPSVARRGTRHVELLRSTLPADGIAALERIQELHATKHEMDVHFTLQRVLRGWLYLHLPVAIVLLGLVALHIFFILYF